MLIRFLLYRYLTEITFTYSNFYVKSCILICTNYRYSAQVLCTEKYFPSSSVARKLTSGENTYIFKMKSISNC